MGKVLSDFKNGWLGAISRSVDDIVVALPNAETSQTVAFGSPVTLSDDGKGIKNWRSTKTAANFLGVAVRVPSKTPDTYGASLGGYAPKEMAEVITRGTVIVNLPTGSPTPGGAVYIVKATGAFAAAADDTNTILLTNAHFGNPLDADGHVELVINSRNIL